MLWPRTLAVPPVGWSRLRRSRRSVVLPAPFGPTRPIAPSGIDTVRSSTARTSPKTFVKFAVSTRTIVPSFFGDRLGGRSARGCGLGDSSFSASPDDDHDEDRGDDRDDKEDRRD